MKHSFTALLVPLLVFAGAALIGQPAAAGCRGVPRLALDDFAAPGAHAVGVRTVTFVDESRATPPAGNFPGAPERTLVTEIWYPALAPGRDVALDPGGAPYPVVIFSHGGGGGVRADGTLVGEHLASRGIIVAAPEFPLTGLAGVVKAGLTAEILSDLVNQPADWSFVLDSVLAELGAAVDPERIGATGHSFGGITTLLVTYHRDLRDPRIKAALPLAPATCFLTARFYRGVQTPLLVMHGDSDLIADFQTQGLPAYRRARQPRFLVRLKNGSHLGFNQSSSDPGTHPDAVGCAFLNALFGEILDLEEFFRPIVGPLGDRAAGIRIARRCTLACTGPPPQGPAMPVVRHNQLTRATVAAFFDAYLRGDDAARCFLVRTLGQEADVQVKSRGAAKAAPLSPPG